MVSLVHENRLLGDMEKDTGLGKYKIKLSGDAGNLLSRGTDGGLLAVGVHSVVLSDYADYLAIDPKDPNALYTWASPSAGMAVGSLVVSGGVAPPPPPPSLTSLNPDNFTASTTYSGGQPGLLADGDLLSGWGTDNVTWPQWVAVDAEAIVQVSAYKISRADYMPGGWGDPKWSPRRWELQGNDVSAAPGSPWQTVDTRLIPAPITTANSPQVYTLTAPASFRYWRLLISEGFDPATTWVNITEFELI
ncbi:discoidin domain-containing protein [Thiothrix winogradskyi]|uniref:Discoidin domain-containing protein n=1 Tax=Thiothrix winogradskyi TaxID=96472 RepID=A0ABY3T3X7_9GAMM|nr:discoidin domain-containing protein [Thiothrix winogradskyi]UJS26266.1 discoidin domain-containing protein [Thiothrix winogradskyi]